MVALKKELANTLFTTTFTTTFTTIQPKLIAYLPSNININININMIRRRSTFSSQINFRKSSTHSTVSLTPYYERLEIQNNLLNEDKQELVESFKFSYASSKK